MDRAGIEKFHNLGYTRARRSRALTALQPPFYGFDVPVVLGDRHPGCRYAGAVHTALATVRKISWVGQKYGLEVANPVGSNGVCLRIPNCCH